MKALHDLVQWGKVRYIGASSIWTCKSFSPSYQAATRASDSRCGTDQFARYQHVAEKNGWTKFISMKNHYSLLYREEEPEMNKFCHETGVGLIPWGPLYSGWLARPLAQSDATIRATEQGKVLTDADKAIVTRVEEIASRKGWQLSQVALAWIIQKTTIPIVGFSPDWIQQWM
jgi:aryl-alcohol dehydrogenase-like predicted oxidoreductase